MSATEGVAEPFLTGLYFGEGPRWHDGRLWYSDFFDLAVFSADPSGNRRREVDVPTRPSGLGWLPDGRLLIVSMVDRVLLRQEADGELVRHGTLTPWATFHANDMVVSAEGRAYVGNFGFDLDAAVAGGPDRPRARNTSVVRVDPDGSSCEAAADLAFPNGTVLFPGGRTMVIAESMATRLTAFDVSPDGGLSNRRVWATLEGCAPDGICLDEEGCVWVANALAGECIRVAAGGEVRARLKTEDHCYACMLGGEDRRTLYMLTAPTNTEEVAKAARRGRILQARVDVPGAGLP